MSRSGGEDLADEFFAKTNVESTVGFEIAFAAFLATAVLTYPTLQAQWVGKTAAIAVLLFTLVRRIAIASPYASERKILEKTVRWIESATTICVIVLFYAFSERLSSLFGGSAYIWFAVVAPVILLLIVIAQEFLFRDYLG